jgi:hypothetical protein
LLAIAIEDFLWYVDTALDQMTAIVLQLGDETASRRPALAGANSPYAILTHCLGVMEFWGGETVAGRTIERDREAEFRAEGRVADLCARTSVARRQLDDDLADFDSLAPPKTVAPGDEDEPVGRTQGGVLVHVIEELFQHLGQMELSRDVLLASSESGAKDQ